MRFTTVTLLLAMLLLVGACADQSANEAAPAAENAMESANEDANTDEEAESADEGEVITEPEDAPEVAAGDDHGDGIAWYDGTVDEAFAFASSEGKPLFLYWGAEWCPPCHYLKTKVFKTPEFVAKSQDFVPVYLDGDDEGAQVLGEDLGVAGYPTVIVFSPSGEEVMRMSSGIPVQQYATVLDAALARMVPIADVLAAVKETGAANAAQEDLELLAFHAWGQDDSVEFEEGEELETFTMLYDETPDELVLEKSRFLAAMMNALIDADSAAASEAEENEVEPEPVLTDDERAALTTEVLTLLGDPELRNANLYYTLYWSRETAELLEPEAGEAQDTIIAAWDDAAQAVENDESLSMDDRLTALYPRLELARLVGDNAAAAEAALAEAAGEEAAAEDGGAEDATEGEVAEGEAAEEEAAEEDAVEEEAAEAPPEPQLPEELVAHVRERVQWAGDTVTDGGELQAVMSTMVWLLEEIGDDAEAEALLETKMGDTVAPYYFMSWLAGKKAEAEDPEAAIEWYRKAYDSATGRYTRFRWGSTYLRKLLELDAENVEKNETEAYEILGELLTRDDAFALGNHSRLGSYEKDLQSWNEDGTNDEVVARIRDFVQAECERYPDGEEDSQQARCLAFLAPEEDEAAEE